MFQNCYSISNWPHLPLKSTVSDDMRAYSSQLRVVSEWMNEWMFLCILFCLVHCICVIKPIEDIRWYRISITHGLNIRAYISMSVFDYTNLFQNAWLEECGLCAKTLKWNPELSAEYRICRILFLYCFFVSLRNFFRPWLKLNWDYLCLLV